MREKAQVIGLGAAIAAEVHPVYMALLALIVLDFFMGLSRAWMRRKISSDIGRKGVTKKASMLAVVLGVNLLQHLAGWNLGFDVAQALATFYCITEFASIVENADSLGVPIPAWLRSRIDGRKKELQDGSRS